LALYVAFYLFVIRIAALRPFTPTLLWGLLTTFVVAFAEELYFRGILFSAIQDRFSPRVALVATAILFGLFHARQGLIVMLARTFTGWLWGSVRYASGMIFLLIFPVHVAFNAVWLLFQGNWSNPPAWATVALPAAEFLLGLTIVLVSDRFHRVDERQR
jgi:membrane protease YdiL (CAAX protease family)